MSRSAALIHYLHDCYRADNQEQAILDLMGSKVEYHRFLPRAGDLLSGVLDHLPVVDPELETMAKKAALHRTEKALELGAFFVVGTVLESGDEERRRKLCAPLVSFGLEAEEEPQAGPGAVLLSIDLDRPRLNTPLLSLMAGAVAGPGGRGELLESLAEQLPEPPWDREGAAIMGEILDALPGLVGEELTAFPDLVAGAEVERLRRSRARPRGALDARCLPAAAVMFSKRSINTRGVLSELDRLAAVEARDAVAGVGTSADPSDGAGVSAPLAMLLGEGSASRPKARRGFFERFSLGSSPRHEATGRVPAVLSRAQQKILRVAAREPLSLVVGPPGTGKSFTIASLTLDALQRGESVLVVSKMNHAVDVVADKVDSLVGERGLVVRGGRREYKRQLLDRLENIVAGILPFEPRGAEEHRDLRRALGRSDLEIRQLAAALDGRAEAEQRWGTRMLRWREASGTFGRWMGRLGTLRRPPRRPEHWQLMERYQALLGERIERAAELLRSNLRRRIDGALRGDRTSLTRLLAALRSRTVERRRSLFEEARRETLFSAFPVWMSNLSDLASVLPLERELFDLVIVDEASQCDLASCMPALQRGRRAVVVGDPKQLRHLSFLARRQQRTLGRRHGLDAEAAERFDFRDKSLLDLVSDVLPSQEVVTLLDEHFRSLPQIIAFSNREVYGGRLRVMQERPIATRARDGGAPVRWHRLEGSRDASGANPREAEALVEDLVALVEAEAGCPPTMRHSLGVLSPFRGQVDLLSRLIEERLDGGAIERHDLRVGSPYAFQGEERDAMFLSLALDGEAHAAAFRYVQRPDVFNVAITRARSLQRIYTSLDAAQAPRGGLLASFLEFLEAQGEPRDPSSEASWVADRATDPFARQVAEALGDRGWRTWSRWPVAGFVVDLVAEKAGRCVGIDLVGYPGDLAGAFQLERYRVFARAGLRIVPLPYSVWHDQREACLAAVEAAPHQPSGTSTPARAIGDRES